MSYQHGWAPPNLTGALPGAQGGGGDLDAAAPPPSVVPLRVTPSSLRDAELDVTGPLENAVNALNELKAYVEGVKHWVFYRPEHPDIDVPPNMRDQFPDDDSLHEPPSQDALDMVSRLDNLMAGGSNMLLVTGIYLDIENTAGQMYVAADKNSAFPPA